MQDANKVESVTPPVARKYAILQETSDEDGESWYYFIKHDGNEEALKKLEEQLDSVEWELSDDLCTFILERQVLVSESTAKEMTKVDLNSQSFHRKFDGELKDINFGFSKRDTNEDKMVRVYELLNHGMIENYIDQEDIDPEDLVDRIDSCDSEYTSTDESSTSESEDDDDDRKTDVRSTLPRVAMTEIPRVARARRYRTKDAKDQRRKE